MTEREAKLTLPGTFAMPALELDGEPLKVEVLPDQTLRATYFDTADLRLARHGVTLRYRTGEGEASGWTLKFPVAASGSSLERDELHFDGPRREPPAEARALVTAYARGADLGPVATLRTRRRRMTLAQGDGPLAEMADDEVSVIEGRRVVSRFREVEIEALADDLDLDGLADQLHRAGASDAEPIPKVVRALGSRATAPPDVRPLDLGGEPRLSDVAAASVADALVRTVRNDPPARLGEPEGVHQLRVAMRRLRSDLRTLGDAVDPEWRAAMEPRLRALGDALADARDADVMGARLRAELDGSTAAMTPLFNALEERRGVARERLEAALTAPAYVELLDDLVRVVASPPAGPGDAPASAGMGPLVLAAFNRLARRADALDDSSPDEEFHRTRIAVKRARYAAELAARVLDGTAADGARTLGQRLADLQDMLGDLQDAAVAEATVRQTLSGRGAGPRYAFEAGRLVERLRARAEAARAGFLEAWPQIRRRRWRKWAM